MSAIELRPYQMDMANGIRASFAKHRRVLGVAPTGAGKTVLFAYITKNAAAKGNPVIIQAHRSNIVDQISGALDKIGIRHGRIQPGHSMTDDLVQVAMVQTLTRRLERVRPPKLIITDEAHHASATQYKSILEYWPDARSLGVTATPERPDGKGLNECYDEMVMGPQMSWLIENGFLAKYSYLAPPPKADLSSVKVRGNDYDMDALAEAMDKAVITGDAISHYRTYLKGAPAIAFCVKVSHAESVAAEFRAAGYRAAAIDGKMSREEQNSRLAALGNGGLQVLTSCQLISEGTDIPAVSGAICLTKTKSIVKYLQDIGRTLRLKPDGGEAIILDHVGNIHTHGMPDAPREWSLEGKKKGAIPPGASTCEKCFRAFSAVPGWKATAECAEGEPEGCILEPSDKEPAGGKEAPEVVDGELVKVTNIPSWSDGLNIATARGPDFGELLDLADTLEKLKEIAKSRGYHWKWATRTWERRQVARLGVPA